MNSVTVMLVDSNPQPSASQSPMAKALNVIQCAVVADHAGRPATGEVWPTLILAGIMTSL